MSNEDLIKQVIAWKTYVNNKTQKQYFIIGITEAFYIDQKVKKQHIIFNEINNTKPIYSCEIKQFLETFSVFTIVKDKE